MKSLKETFFRNIVNNINDGVIIVDSNRLLLYMNPYGEELIGLSATLSIGKPIDSLFHENKELLKTVNKGMNSDRIILSHEVVKLRKTGCRININTTPLLLDNGKREGTIIILRDISRVTGLEDVSDEKEGIYPLETIAAMLAHEIKNPLGGIRGAAQLLAMELGDKKDFAVYTDMVIKEVDRINRIVEELLDVASPPFLKMKEVNLHALLADILLLQESAVGDDIKFHREMDPSIPLMLGDEERLKQLFLNLIKNAVEALPQGGTIGVSNRVLQDYRISGSEEKSSKMVIVEITDNGVGIPKEELERIFRPYYTLKSNGTGLGLAICHKIVVEHSGSIKVRSGEGETKFTVILPTS
ncbi:MAG: ATP-binding protein [Desulfuromonadales bacterium]|nr:ATP-binding protein [Desulfuromonadales bacterium]